MKRILVGVDGSDISKAAAEFAAGIARATGAELQLVCAFQPQVPYYGEGATPEVATQEYDDAIRTAKASLSDSAALAALSGTGVTTLAVEGMPADVLAELAKGEVDLVVVGHRGRNAVARALLGSVADRLVQICPRPVLVFR
jgi:nucleotide-binding universal stress UspA family protein